MTKHSKHERERRAAETERMKEVSAAWYGSIPAATAAQFTRDVEASHAPGPRRPRPTWPPGTRPNPPRPGREPSPRRRPAALAQVLLMTRKRKVTYPPPRSSRGPAPAYVPQVTLLMVATINTKAGVGRSEIVPGMRVIIQGTGLYTGETAVVQSLVPGVISAAVVKTEAGQTRRVRTVDLSPAPKAVAATAAPAPAEPTAAAPTAAAPAEAAPAEA